MHLKLAQTGDEKEQTDGSYRRLNHPVSVPVKKGLRQIRVRMKWKRMLEFIYMSDAFLLLIGQNTL